MTEQPSFSTRWSSRSSWSSRSGRSGWSRVHEAGRAALATAGLGAAAIVAAGGAPAQQVSPEITYVQLAESHGCVHNEIVRDVDGDGHADLVISAGTCGSDSAGQPRRLLCHLRKSGSPAFASRPDRSLDLVRDVVAYAVGDVHPNPGSELVLLSPTRAVAVYWEQGRVEPRYVALAKTRLLWQPAVPWAAFPWQAGVRDIDGDGLDDLLLPEPDGYRIAFQRRDAEGRASFEHAVQLRLPPRPISQEDRSRVRFDRQRGDFGISIGADGASMRGPLLEIEDEIPAPDLVDWDGDGDLDVAALGGRMLWVWRQDAPGEFQAEPAETHTLPDRRSALLTDLTYSVQVADVDGDRRADVVIVSSRTEGDEIQSAVEVFLHGPAASEMFGDDPRASDRLRLQGFVDVPRIEDVDGDGKPDLTIGSLRPDLIDAIASGSSGSVEGQLNLFRNTFTADGGRFERPVALVFKTELPGDSLRNRRRIVTRFFRDVDGNGMRDLLLRTDRKRIEVRPTLVQAGTLRIGDPVWGLNIDENARVEVVESAKSTILAIRELRQIVYVEFR